MAAALAMKLLSDHVADLVKQRVPTTRRFLVTTAAFAVVLRATLQNLPQPTTPTQSVDVGQVQVVDDATGAPIPEAIVTVHSLPAIRTGGGGSRCPIFDKETERRMSDRDGIVRLSDA